jgi:hypothetical protein
MAVFRAGKGQTEMIKPVIEWHAGNVDAEIAHRGEIGQPQPAGRMLLSEDDITIGAVERPPAPDAALQRAPDTGANFGMAASDLVKNSDWPQARHAPEKRHDLAIPNRRQRILPAPPARRFLLRRKPRILFNAISGRRAEPSLGRGNTRRLGLAQTHEKPHLAIGDVAVGQGAVPHRHEEPASYPAGPDRQTTQPLAGLRRSPDSRLQSGCALPASRIRRHFLIQIDAPLAS